MKKTAKTLAIAALTTMTATAAVAEPDLIWPTPGTTATISLAPVAVKNHRGTEFEKGWRFAVGGEIPLDFPGLALYNDLSYMAADRAGDRGDISVTTISGGVRASLSTGVLSPYGQLGLGLAYVDQDGDLGGNDWRPAYTIGAGIISSLGAYRIDLGWQFDTLNVTGGTLGAHTFSLTTHVPLGW